jgi:hypothetical protein
LNPFEIDSVADTLKENNHFTATIERMPGVFLVDQATEQACRFHLMAQALDERKPWCGIPLQERIAGQRAWHLQV